MSGPTLLGSTRSGPRCRGNAPTRVLKPSGAESLPDGGAGLVVSDAEKPVRRPGASCRAS